MIDYASLAAALRVSARPPNSPGWGMVRCVKTGELKSRDGREVVRVVAGKTRCVPDYWAVRDWPEFFMPIDKRDTRTRDTHKRNLARAQQVLERATPRARAPRSSSLLPPRRPNTAQPWRLR